MTGRPKLAPGTWGVVMMTETDGEHEARLLVRLLDGSYQRVKRKRRGKAAAQQAVLDAAATALSTTRVSTLSGASTFAALVADWYEYETVTDELRRQTVEQQYSLAVAELLPRMGKLSIRELTVPICERVYRDMLKPRRPLNRNRLEYGEPRVMEANARGSLWVMRKVLRRAVILGLRDDNPAAVITPVRRAAKTINVLDVDGVQQLRAAVAAYADRPGKGYGGPKLKYLDLVFDIMIGTGARIGEVLAIRAVDDIDLLPSPLIVHIQGTIVEYKGRGAHRQAMPKTSKSRRSIQVPLWLDAAIRSWLSEPQHADSVLLFETRNGTAVSTHNLRRSLRKVRAWAGLPEWIVPHVMRKTAATTVTGAHGTDQGMWFMGHADTRVLEGSYDKRGTVPYTVTRSLEAFSRDGVAPEIDLAPVIVPSGQGPALELPDAEVTAKIDKATAEADDILAGMAAAMGVPVEQLPSEVRVGVRASILAKAF